ncbi:preprotein translocase subunit SecG [[Mycoplasma] mobile]|uniref:preprotein translocase subunit SecG n=1 Tax=[Mycoplasma] mobile TaxID=2118 RepID=UPI0003045FC2|nr:preprotein translocase subunit SecG [[Mycoplasma] mobile]
MSIAIIISIPLFIISFLMIIVSFLMSPDSNSFSGALVGSSDLDLFKVNKEKGFKKFLKYSMGILGFILFATALLVRLVI